MTAEAKPPTTAELEKLRDSHRAPREDDWTGCVKCGLTTPCPTHTLAAEVLRLRGQVEQVRAVRARIMDRVQFVTEGPLIGRLKIDSWLGVALDAEPGDQS